MTRQLMQAFRSVLRTAVSEFRPHVILCHHLYFLAALAREMFPEIPVYGQCHGSDLRQLATNAWQGDWIKEGIRDLNGIFALHEAQKKQICDMFGLEPHRVTVVGTGYNSNVFFRDEEAKAARDSEKFRYIFAGKLSEKKGVYSLLSCLKHLEKPDSVEILLAGGCGSEEELAKLKTMAARCPCTVTFLGKLDQKTLACRMNQSDAFILPSFYEGLPLVLIEAMACGLRTICTDLPGIRTWLNKALPHNSTIFVAPPEMRNTDESIPETLPDFEKRLARAMDDARQAKLPDEQQVARLSWDALCEKLTYIFRR
jgi:glycosyltransferase involved in cell wall biosynthesis